MATTFAPFGRVDAELRRELDLVAAFPMTRPIKTSLCPTPYTFAVSRSVTPRSIAR
jgi:hypothetical protein